MDENAWTKAAPVLVGIVGFPTAMGLLKAGYVVVGLGIFGLTMFYLLRSLGWFSKK